MKSDGETPSKFWRPQDVWIAGRNNFGVRNPGQLNRSWREPEPSKLSYLGDSYDAYGGDRIGIKKIGLGNWPSKNPGRPLGPGRGNNPPRTVPGNWPSKNPGRPSGPGRGNNPPRKR